MKIEDLSPENCDGDNEGNHALDNKSGVPNPADQQTFLHKVDEITEDLNESKRPYGTYDFGGRAEAILNAASMSFSDNPFRHLNLQRGKWISTSIF